jgi:hypothetical protein
MGDRATNAIKIFQTANQLPAPGQMDVALQGALGL